MKIKGYIKSFDDKSAIDDNDPRWFAYPPQIGDIIAGNTRGHSFIGRMRVMEIMHCDTFGKPYVMVYCEDIYT